VLPPISFAALRRTMPARVRRRVHAASRRSAARWRAARFFGEVNEATARVLAAEGCDVIIRGNKLLRSACRGRARRPDAVAAAKRLIDNV